MISRRNIRVKVMQLLYVLESSGDKNFFKDPITQLQKNINKTNELLVYLIYNLTEVIRYVEIDAKNRASKHLPSYQDLNVNTKIAGNTILWGLLENNYIKDAFIQYKCSSMVNTELIRKLYLQLIETEEYKTYIANQQRDKKEDKVIVDFVFNSLMLPNELFDEHIDELFSNWDDDAELMQQLVNAFIQKPGNDLASLLPEETLSFGKLLLKTVIEKNSHTLETIKPKLKNWDSDRIAVLDMILMQMGIC
ncbi:MAG TPA: transcription antitermination factor NusB, partial [Chitinophagaceae bacterium]|nr:transcription antitermination factor NusB [Chitinophagaceae bacterium]